MKEMELRRTKWKFRSCFVLLLCGPGKNLFEMQEYLETVQKTRIE